MRVVKNLNLLSAIDKTTSDTDLDGDFDQADYSKTSSQALNVDPASNRLLGFSQTLSSVKGDKTNSTTSQINYSLDQNGNLTSDGLHHFDYDAANRLTQVQLSQDGEAAKVSYLHNALGQRVFKSEPQLAQTVPSEDEPGVDFVAWLKRGFGWLFAQAQTNATLGQSYVYDDSPIPNLLGEYGNGGSKSKGRIEYIWLPTEDGQSIPIGLFKDGNFYAIHSDHLNTPRLITNEDRKPVWQWPYSAFGDNPPSGVLKVTTHAKAALTEDPQSKAQLKRTAPAFEVNLRFAGQYFDEESNLSYNYFRSYQPSQGRFTQPDPVGLAGGLSRFSYVEGNPLSMTDPMGLMGGGGNHAGRRQAPGPAQAVGSLADFWRNYSDMRTANTIGADKYFHCKANCEATRRGDTGESTACKISDTREWFDQTVKGDPASASQADQAANTFGRGNAGTSGSCDVVCGIYRPNGLPSRY